MVKLTNRACTIVLLLVVSLIAIFYPDVDKKSRLLSAIDGEGSDQRELQANPASIQSFFPTPHYYVTPPPEYNVAPYRGPITPKPLDERRFQAPPLYLAAIWTPSPTDLPIQATPAPIKTYFPTPHYYVTPPPEYNIAPYRGPITPKPLDERRFQAPPLYLAAIWTPSPTDLPIQATLSPVLPTSTVALPTSATTPAPILPTSSPFNSGVNGDPLIMGLSGQLFKFDGRSGAWYSAVSTKSFQWNFRTQIYEKCPADSNNFISGVGISIMNQKVEVNVVNPYDIDVGCGKDMNQNCLGAGSLELIIDGMKHVVGGDYSFNDGSGRIIAFNTYHQCKSIIAPMKHLQEKHSFNDVHFRFSKMVRF
jgi:hypothetical protein